ncbi:MAG: ABC transporter substrate-binding protein [Gemmatimonadales bacterium]
MLRRLASALLIAWLVGCVPSREQTAVITFTDDGGHTTTLAAPATRVVSLVPAATELVYALGAGHTLVGRTRWCDYPEAAQQVPSVGDGVMPNVEAVVGQRPDLVIAYQSPGNVSAVTRLRALGIPVLEIAINRLSDFERDTRLLATALGRPEAGDSLVESTRSDLDSATVSSPSPPTVLIVTWSDPPIVIGAGSFLNEILGRAGAVNLYDDSERPSFVVSIESVVDRDPDWILAVGESDPAFLSKPEWQVVPAVRERRLLRVSGSMFNRPSPRIGQAVRQLRTVLETASQ